MERVLGSFFNANQVFVEVHSERLIARLPGTSYLAVYLKTPDGHGVTQSPTTIVDNDAVISREDFESLAWEAASSKARELGWGT